MNLRPRAEAWMAHYVRKGCHPVKADSVAWAKVRKSHTWPPQA
ncbi:hypothetical protein [Mesorhizobium opportunistum]|nr:hypothetical protein [Mesorhizobium opportunistum]